MSKSAQRRWLMEQLVCIHAVCLWYQHLGVSDLADMRACVTTSYCLQIHRIQNKKLWRAFCHSQASMKERWAHEPGLPLLNGGLETLWHGTSATEPHKIYATELGQAFMEDFCALRPCVYMVHALWYHAKACVCDKLTTHCDMPFSDYSLASKLCMLPPTCYIAACTGAQHLKPWPACMVHAVMPILVNAKAAADTGLTCRVHTKLCQPDGLMGCRNILF